MPKRSRSFYKPASKFTTDFVRGIYLVNQMRTRYVYRSGLLHIPMADKQACKFLRWAQDTGVMIVEFAVARFGLMPKYPTHEVNDQNLVFLGGDVEVSAPSIDLDGTTYTYSVVGWYVYGLKKPVFVQDGLKMSALTIDTTATTVNVLPA